MSVIPSHRNKLSRKLWNLYFTRNRIRDVFAATHIYDKTCMRNPIIEIWIWIYFGAMVTGDCNLHGHFTTNVFWKPTTKQKFWTESNKKKTKTTHKTTYSKQCKRRPLYLRHPQQYSIPFYLLLRYPSIHELYRRHIGPANFIISNTQYSITQAICVFIVLL